MTQLSAVLAPSLTAADCRAQRDTTATRRDQAAFACRKVALTDFREVEDALASVERLGEEETAVGAEREVYARTLKLASNRYRAGYLPYSRSARCRAWAAVRGATLFARTQIMSWG